MALTMTLKEELARVPVAATPERRAETAAMLRFAGGLHLVAGRVVVEVELDHGASARRLRAAITELYGLAPEIVVVSGGNLRRGQRYVLRVVRGGEDLARQTGLIDQRGRPVRGPAPHGSLTEPGRSAALEVTTPGPEAALALVGAARRLRVAAKAREVRQSDRVVVRDGEAIATLLAAVGAEQTATLWRERRERKEVRATANRLANFDDANLRRSAQAAVTAGAKVERALEILGDEVPDHLRYAGRLRLEHKQASLDELGRLADPPMTKDAVAGRIRRLLAMADKRAAERGIPGTDAASEG